VAQVIRRFRDLDMPLDQVKAIPAAPDLGDQDQGDHLSPDRDGSQARGDADERGQPAGTARGDTGRATVEFRSIPATPALTARATVTAEESWAWGADAFEEIYGRIARVGLSPVGPGGALFPAGFFELEQAGLTAFVPVSEVPPVDGRVRSLTIPAVEAAVMLHAGPLGDADQTYGHSARWWRNGPSG
jgi:effector-binding domain-containing protein